LVLLHQGKRTNKNKRTEQKTKKKTQKPNQRKNTSHGLIKMALRKTAKRSDRKIYAEICKTAPGSE
jgi:hypothetical protein